MEPGKTAPRLLEDLLSYDPRTASIGKNLLADPTPIYDEKTYVSRVPKNSCRHQYILNYLQSVTPLLDDRPGQDSKWRVTSICQNCRCHLTVTVDFGGSAWKTSPCPTAERPLHFFVLQSRQEPQDPWLSEDVSVTDREQEYCFRCTARRCVATLRIKVSPPRLTSKQINLLTDPQRLRMRYNAAVAADSTRNFEEANGALVLYRLRTYLRDSLDPKSARSEFPKKNKIFLVSFGNDCNDFLRSLGFADETDSEGEPIWSLPRPPSKVDGFDQSSHRAFLEDVMEELGILTLNKPASERSLIKNFTYQPIPSRKDLERVLGMPDYERASSSRRYDPSTPEHPYYASLGAVADFSDNLILYSYDRQVECDGQNSPYYFECLQDLAAGRNSDALQTKVATLASQDQISRKDVTKAYKYFGIDENHLEIVTDDHILGLFQSRLPDIPYAQESEMRDMLRTLARARNSALLSNAASDTIETYSQALSWLGAEESTPDDFILTLFKMKVDESPSHRETAQKAVQLVADTRKSEGLQTFLMTGEIGESELEPAEAYRILDIPDRTLDDDFIISIYELRLEEAPVREKEFARALKSIAKEKGSRRLAGIVGLDQSSIMSPVGPPLQEWPVGLPNLANTCYLNSVVQLLFSLKPFRDLVLNFEYYKMDMTPQNMPEKRVGGAIRTVKEVELSQQFVSALGKVFNDMIHADTRIAKYDTEFARLTLASLSKDLLGRRRSTVSASRPSIMQDVQSEQRLQSLPESDSTPFEQASSDQPSGSRASSQETLVEISITESSNRDGSKDIHMTDIDTSQPDLSKLNDTTNMGGQSAVADLSDGEGINEHIEHASTDNPVNGDNMMAIEPSTTSEPGSKSFLSADKTTDTANPPPTRAAPKPELPPRPNGNSQKDSQISAVEDTAKQQDAAEVTDNIVSKLRTAIKPTGFDSRGEQMDQIRDLLFGTQKDVIVRPNGKEDTITSVFDNIRLHLPTSLHIYDALDDVFDIQDKELDGGIVQGHTAIESRPPVLGMQVERGGWDDTKKQSYKIENHLQLEDVIYLDRYMDSDDAQLNRMKQQKWQWRKERAALQAERATLVGPHNGMDAPTTISEAARFITSLKSVAEKENSEAPSIDDDLAPSLQQKATELEDLLAQTTQNLEELSRKMNTQFLRWQKAPYRLYALCMHRGNPGFGHYWVYIHDFANGIWRKYNDERVEKVNDPDVEIFQPSKESSPIPTPHYVIYIRDDIKDLIVEPVCRSPTSTRPDREVEMKDAEVNGVVQS
ncbi:MAG: hypothetical protein Q9165_002798 [Trypethelium subeluteriae]